jgi:hypothetical protein
MMSRKRREEPSRSYWIFNDEQKKEGGAVAFVELPSGIQHL